MQDNDINDVSRRDFLQTGAAVAGVSGLALGGATPATAADDPKPESKKTLPTRPLGKTGVDVTILNQGTWQASGLDRILRFAYDQGIRYFDTAKSYGSEPGIKKWLQAMPEVRKNIFLVTKDSPHTPKQLIPMLDQRLAALGVDHVDLIFCHAMGDHNEPIDWPKSKEFKETIETIKKSGKAKFVGFSTHHARRAEYLQAAADGGFVDVIMLQYTPWLDKDAPLNRALDACWKKGIGLVSMKQVAGQFGEATKGGPLDEVFKKAPMLKEKGLTPYQALLHAIWTDERISTSCVSMRNTDQIRSNVDAARRFEPLKQAELHQLHEAVLAAGPTLCADCDGRCAVAAGTKARLGDLTRYLTYHEYHGDKHEARQNYAALTEAERDWRGADLAAAREACPSGLDFARLLPKADDLLS
ncbi:MAG: putative oxidoreductase of aldo/keto reductase family [Planctomycetota bacterium]|nr:putative oxidoreductase of aldo/keto reductase family [Planctomycetota bacterium]